MEKPGHRIILCCAYSSAALPLTVSRDSCAAAFMSRAQMNLQVPEGRMEHHMSCTGDALGALLCMALPSKLLFTGWHLCEI